MSKINNTFDSTVCEMQLETEINHLKVIGSRTLAQYGNNRMLRYKCLSNILENRLVRKLNELLFIRLRKFGVLDNSDSSKDHRPVGAHKIFQRLWNKHKNIAKGKDSIKPNRSQTIIRCKQNSSSMTKIASLRNRRFVKKSQQLMTVDKIPAIQRIGSTPKRAGIPQMGYLHRLKASWAQQLPTNIDLFKPKDELRTPEANFTSIEETIQASSSSSTNGNCSEWANEMPNTAILVDVVAADDAKETKDKSFLRTNKLKRLKHACSKWTLQRLKLSGLIR